MHKHRFLAILLFCSLLFGCGASTQPDVTEPAAGIAGADANAFNPWMNAHLPNTRAASSAGADMLSKLGATAQSIEGEAAYRKNWREEIYPVVFGDRNAPNEIIVVLDFAKPDSEKAWSAALAASKSLSPSQCKIVVFGHSGEPYGTELMGLAIWISHQRKGQAMAYLDYALKRWNAVKAAQQGAGVSKKFVNEYDATITAQDYPIHYGYLSHLSPPVPANQELSVARYCYNAGNVNMYQANQVCQYYGVKKLPAVIVDGKVLSDISAEAILKALGKQG